MMGGILLDGNIDSHLVSNYQDSTTLISEASFHGIKSSNTRIDLQTVSLNDHCNYMQLEEELVPLGVNDAESDAADYYHRLLSLLEPSTFSYDNTRATIDYEIDNHTSYTSYVPCHSINADTTATILPLNFPLSNTNDSVTYPRNFHQSLIPAASFSPFVSSDDSVGKYTFNESYATESSAHQCGTADGYYSSCIATSSPALSLTSIISTNATPAKTLPGPLVVVEDEGYNDNFDIRNCKKKHSFLSSSGQSESLDSRNSNVHMEMGVMSNTGISEKHRAPIQVVDKMIKKKRKRTRSRKNMEELESQRMTHIAVERNRRQQMNQHLNTLRSLMPSSYIQRGDQASIVGGAIRFVGELQQVLQSLRLQRQLRGHTRFLSHMASSPNLTHSTAEDSYACSQSSNVSVEVNIMASSSTILVKVLVPRRRHQLLHTLHAISLLSLKVLHLNITSLDITMLYSFNTEVEKHCKFPNPIELAKSIHHILETSKYNCM